MNRLSAQMICGFLAFAGAIICGYALKDRFSSARLAQRFAESSDAFRRRFVFASNLPMLVGYACGVLALFVFQGHILPGDRFYPSGEALRIACVPLIAGVAFIVLDLIFPPTVFLGRKKLHDP